MIDDEYLRQRIAEDMIEGNWYDNDIYPLSKRYQELDTAIETESLADVMRAVGGLLYYNSQRGRKVGTQCTNFGDSVAIIEENLGNINTDEEIDAIETAVAEMTNYMYDLSILYKQIND